MISKNLNSQSTYIENKLLYLLRSFPYLRTSIKMESSFTNFDALDICFIIPTNFKCQLLCQNFLACKQTYFKSFGSYYEGTNKFLFFNSPLWSFGSSVLYVCVRTFQYRITRRFGRGTEAGSCCGFNLESKTKSTSRARPKARVNPQVLTHNA